MNKQNLCAQDLELSLIPPASIVVIADKNPLSIEKC